MPLTDQQIERYSRQIIVPGVGGQAQERLLASTITVVAEPADAERVLPYMVGAGVGRTVVFPLGNRRAFEAIFQRLHDMNPEVAVGFAESEACDLTFALIGSSRAPEEVARLARAHRPGAAIIVRLDNPPRIAVLPAPPPCVLCADADLIGAVRSRSTIAGLVAMVATTEAFKLLAKSGGQPQPRLIEFNGYAGEARALGWRAGARCACGAT